MLDNAIRVPMDVKVGDEVVYTAFSGIPITNNKGEEFLVINECDILLVLD